MKKLLAELVGTYLLVLLGTSAVVTSLTLGEGKLTPASVVTIALTFGMALIAIAFAFGPISGAHVNPAVTLGMVVGGKMKTGEAVGYWIAQFAGGVLASLTLLFMLHGEARFSLGANGPGFMGRRGALAFEVVSTALFFLVIYGAAASKRGAGALAGIPIGLYLAASHLAGIPISGSSVNPARDFGPYVVSAMCGGGSLSNLWIYFVGPLLGGVLGGVASRCLHEGDA
jgi:aquaporin Z